MRSNSLLRKHIYGLIRHPVSIGLVVASVVVVIIATSRAQAGPGDFFRQTLGNEQVSAQTTRAKTASYSSQRYPLPTYAANINVLAYADASVVPPPMTEGKVLSAEMAAASVVSTVEPPNTQISVYVVRDGDTISGVADLFNVSINTILWANDLTSRSTLRPGQTLVILPVTGIKYTVRSGDTIEGIAKRYGAAIEDVLNYNDLTLKSSLRVGMGILIPNAEVATPVAGSTSKAPAVSASSATYFACPLPGGRVSQKIHGHNGVDLAAPVGTPIRAAAAGTVIISRVNGAWNGGYGNFIVVLHANGSQTLYSHMQKSPVKTGAKVAKGEIVGYVGLTGLTTGPHLHFEVRGAQNPFADPSKCR